MRFRTKSESGPDTFVMEEGPEFEMTENEFRDFIRRLRDR
jgi:hypothetical protein